MTASKSKDVENAPEKVESDDKVDRVVGTGAKPAIDGDPGKAAPREQDDVSPEATIPNEVPTPDALGTEDDPTA